MKYRDIKPDEDLYEVMGMGSSEKDALAPLNDKDQYYF